MNERVRAHTLSNGLRVLTAPLPHAQSVACYVMLAAGSRYENAGNRGIAHFAEHMFFKGTERRPTARDLTMEVDKIGGEFNAFTSKEYTGYYIRCAGEQRDQSRSTCSWTCCATRSSIPTRSSARRA